MDRPALANAFGILGAVCWCIQLLPQIYFNWRRHSAEGLSSGFMMFWACAGVPLGVYNIISDFNIALQVQPQILTCLSLVTWIQCLYYQREWSLLTAVSVVVPVAAVMAGIEVGVVFALRTGLERNVQWPVALMAALAALLLALGVLEQYLAIVRHKTTAGISFLFCAIDAMGDVTSIISVVFEPRLEIVGLVAYAVELVLWLGIFALGGYFKLWPWIKQCTNTTRSRVSQEGPESIEPAAVALYDLPSSSSVFRTPSGEHEVRSRARVAPA